jgi:hypothetical protein
VNVKRAVAAVAGVIGTLILVAAVGVGYLTGHHSSARPGTAAAAHAVAVTQSGTAHVAASHAVPVTATLDTLIYGDSVSVPAIFGDGLDLSLITTTSGDGTAVTGGATVGTSSGGAVGGVVTLAIYGD